MAEPIPEDEYEIVMRFAKRSIDRLESLPPGWVADLLQLLAEAEAERDALRTALEAAEARAVPEMRERFAEDAALWIDPARLGGSVAASGTRLGAEWIAEYVWDGLYDELRSGWDYLSERQILVACWWVATTGPRRYHKAWGAWAAEAHETLARNETLPQPPPPRLVSLSPTDTPENP